MAIHLATADEQIQICYSTVQLRSHIELDSYLSRVRNQARRYQLLFAQFASGYETGLFSWLKTYAEPENCTQLPLDTDFQWLMLIACANVKVC